jgi:CCR4-NOT transcriptional complex subunit CAF120
MVAGKGKDKLLNTIRTIFNAKPKYEGWAFVRFGAGAPWKRCRFVVTPSDEKRFPIRTDQSETMRSMPKGDLKFYHTMNSKKTQIFASITDAWAAYAIYPEAKSLLKQSTLIVIEGRITIHSNSEGSTEGFVFIMPEIPPAVPALETMLRLLFSVWDTFGLYSRPNNSVDETLDSLSSMCVMSNDRIYRCLKLADVCGLVQIQSSNPWNEERWRREMKSLTVKHMAHANHSDV